MYEAGLGAPQ
jgi:TPR repeat protein